MYKFQYDLLSATMLDGWYCRSMNEQALQQQQQQQQHPHPSQSQSRNSLDGDDLGDREDRDGGDSSGQEEDSDEDVLPRRRNIDYKAQYNTLKKKLKYLLYVSSVRSGGLLALYFWWNDCLDVSLFLGE